MTTISLTSDQIEKSYLSKSSNEKTSDKPQEKLNAQQVDKRAHSYKQPIFIQCFMLTLQGSSKF